MAVRLWAWLATVVLILIAAWIGAPPVLRAWWWRQESNPVRRGAEIAARSGCYTCHGPEGARSLPDPNGGESVPQWDGGVPMMYVNGRDEVREYILDGNTRRRSQSASAVAERQAAAVKMPAYRDFLRAREVDDLVAYVVAVARIEPPADPAAAHGLEIVGRYRCESCHGISGSGGVPNPGSLKGYVPGWIGADYSELVRDPAELRSWILDGGIDRFARDRLARFFLGRQRLQMPAYRKTMSEDDAAAVGAYIALLRSATP